jgi:ABC-type amino acid transport substrate-binding protein
VEFVESGFGTFIADLQANKCAIGMFALGVTTKRAQAVEFLKPYLNASVWRRQKRKSQILG